MGQTACRCQTCGSFGGYRLCLQVGRNEAPLLVVFAREGGLLDGGACSESGFQAVGALAAADVEIAIPGILQVPLLLGTVVAVIDDDVGIVLQRTVENIQTDVGIGERADGVVAEVATNAAVDGLHTPLLVDGLLYLCLLHHVGSGA